MLYFLPTPIGNLDDISKRCLDVLQLCDVVICEDTRVSKTLFRLLNAKFNLNIKPSLFFTLNSHRFGEFCSRFDLSLLAEKCCVYVSDAGMPCISDPGAELVRLAQEKGYDYEVLSGANALLLAVAASGIVKKEFAFLGFLNNTGSERKAQIYAALSSCVPVVLYESPKRIVSLVEEVARLDAKRATFLIKEATKKFERKFFGTAGEVLVALKEANLNGEWVAVFDGVGFGSVGGVSAGGVADVSDVAGVSAGDVAGVGGVGENSGDANLSFGSFGGFGGFGSNANGGKPITLDDILNLEIPPKTKAKLIAKLTGKNAKEIYEEMIHQK